jgi:hypothetical protein
VSDGVRDIRGTIVRGSDGEPLGKIDDVIFDHDTMEIHCVVVDSGDWLKDATFLLGAHQVSADPNHGDGLAPGATRQQVENAPQYDKESLRSEDEWKKFEQEFKDYRTEDPVTHLKDSNRILIPPDAAVPARGARAADDYEPTAADLFPERISDVFSDPAPCAAKITLRPKSVARAEEAAAGVTLLKPRWWIVSKSICA